MPTQIATACVHPGCPELVAEGKLCATHRKAKTERYYDNLTDEEKKRRSFYCSKSWRVLRAWTLSHEPLCRSCGLVAQHVDHIVPLVMGGPALDSSNLQPLCASCHSAKTIKENNQLQRGRDER